MLKYSTQDQIFQLVETGILDGPPTQQGYAPAVRIFKSHSQSKRAKATHFARRRLKTLN